MKLINKQTGEMATLTLSSNGEELLLMKNSKMVTRNVKLSDLEEWQDYEEEPCFISEFGKVHPISCMGGDRQRIKWLKEIGNYFETKEEAELAVEKLKAWKRLKDYHIRFDLDFVKNTISFTYRLDGTLHSSVNEERIIFEDMKTIFGGEE